MWALLALPVVVRTIETSHRRCLSCILMGIMNAKCTTPDVNYVLWEEKGARKKRGWLRLLGDQVAPSQLPAECDSPQS